MKRRNVRTLLTLTITAALVAQSISFAADLDSASESESQEASGMESSSEMNAQGGRGGTPPPDEMPQNGQNGTPPSGDMPQGSPGGTPPSGDMPSGDMPSEGAKEQGGPGGQDGGPGGQSYAEGQLGSWNMGGTDASTVDGDDYDYDSALYVTADGIDEEKSSTDRVSEGSYDGTSAEGVVINDTDSGDNGILVYNSKYTIKDSQINLLTDADGTDTCDFSGKGSAVAAFGSDADVTIEDSSIHTSGVATMPVFADDGATVTVKDSTLKSDGGTLYQDYLNSPSQTVMVAPPWILGIMGNSRCSNMMGTGTTTNVIDSETSAGAWAVLSTDAGNDMYLNVCNTSLTLNHADESQYRLQEEGGQISETKDNPYTENYGSGYGTYAIGNAVETFAGAEINVGTYATIFTGGSAIYTALEKGETCLFPS